MPRALRTRTDLEAEIREARAEVMDLEDHPPMTPAKWAQAVKEARARVDALIETWAQR